jgi:hypothetical protein
MVLAGSVAVTLAMWLIPDGYTAYRLLEPFQKLHIYVHELGHGIAALLSGGSFDRFELFSDGGLAHTRSNRMLARAFVCAGGLCGPAVVGGVFLALARDVRWARFVLGTFGAFMALSLVIWTRSAYGWVFGAFVAGSALFVALKASAAVSRIVLVFVGVQLALSVYTGGGYLFTRHVKFENGHSGPSDTETMSLAIGLPYWFWGLVCAAFSVAVLAVGMWWYLRPRGRATAAAR